MDSRESVERADWSLRRSSAVLSIDLALTAGYAIVAVSMIGSGFVDGPLRVALGVPLVFLLPGYALVSALFPAADETVSATSSVSRRLVLAFGASVTLLPIVGVVYAVSPLPFETEPVTGALAGVTVLLVIVGMVRRWRLRPDDRFSPRMGEHYVRFRRWLLADRPVDRLLNSTLALSIVIAVLAIGFALAAPPDADPHTEFYVVTGEDEPVAANYPTELVENESAEVRLGIENREGGASDYELIVQLEELTGDDDLEVTDRDDLSSETISLESGDRWEENVTIEPTRTGENLRVAFLLYIDDVPEDPTTENAYRYLHLWIDVESEEAMNESG